MKITDEAYSEVCDELVRLKKKMLSAEDRGYLLGILKEHLEYYRTLAGNTKATPATRDKVKFLESLWMKLV